MHHNRNRLFSINLLTAVFPSDFYAHNPFYLHTTIGDGGQTGIRIIIVLNLIVIYILIVLLKGRKGVSVALIFIAVRLQDDQVV